MMWLLTIALLGPCSHTTSLREGQPAPCTGVLWSLHQTTTCLACLRADLPKCQSDLTLVEDLKINADIACTARLKSCDNAIDRLHDLVDATEPVGTPWTMVLTVAGITAAVAFSMGLYAGMR